MIPRNVVLIVHFHLTHLLPLSTSIFLLPPPNARFFWYQRTQETSGQVWYQPNFCHSKKLYKPPESRTVYEGLTVVSLQDFHYRRELWCLEGWGVCTILPTHRQANLLWGSQNGLWSQHPKPQTVQGTTDHTSTGTWPDLGLWDLCLQRSPWHAHLDRVSSWAQSTLEKLGTISAWFYKDTHLVLGSQALGKEGFNYSLCFPVSLCRKNKLCSNQCVKLEVLGLDVFDSGDLNLRWELGGMARYSVTLAHAFWP